MAERSLPLAGCPFLPITILVAYMYFIKYFGPQFMKNKQPYNLRIVTLVYNVVQIVINGFLSGVGLYFEFYHITSFYCPQRHEYAFIWGYAYYVSRYLDLFETVLFVLRKKDKQVSFLHVYHHLLVITVCYITLFVFTYSLSLHYATLNSLVHFVMYMYYFISAYDSQNKLNKYKQHITTFQMVQFFILFAIFSTDLIFEYCEYPRFLLWTGFTQSILMMYLFGDFYYKSYIVKNKRKLK